MLAYHFVGDRLRDGRLVPKDGQQLRHTGPVRICESGLHASQTPAQALRYAPGPWLCLVECGGTIVHDKDKLACSKRTIIDRIDATEMMYYFARMQALSVAHLWDAPDAVLDYLMTGDIALTDAAWAAARAAARDAVRAATWAAARAAFWAADADRDAAFAAARAADAAWAAADDDFNQMVYETFRYRGSL